MNKIIQALSNRGGPFQDPALGHDPNFLPHPESAPEKALREKLFLNVTSTDYYLKNYANLIHVYPEMERQFGDTSVTYIPELVFPRGLVVTGADLISAPNRHGVFTDPASEILPVPMTYTVYYQSETLVKIVAKETGASGTAGCGLSGTDPNKYLNVDWPDWVPFQGLLLLKKTWEDGASVVLETWPSRFPSGPLANRCAEDVFLNELLIQNHLVDAFHGTYDDVEKLAMALTVLGLANTTVFPSQ